MNAKAVPAPVTKNGPARSLQKPPWTGMLVAHRMPVPMSPMPNAITSLADTLADEGLRQAGERDRGDRRGEPGEPGLDRRVAEDLLHVERPDEDEAKKLPPSSRPTALAPASVRSRKMRSGISGSSARDSMIRNVTIRARPMPRAA